MPMNRQQTKYYNAKNGGVWQEVDPEDHEPDGDAASMSSASNAGDSATGGLQRSKSTSSSRNSLKSTGTDYGQGSSILKVTRGIKQRQRVILKNGIVNLSKEHISNRGQRYLQDIFTTLVDIQWRYNLLVFTMGFVLSWLIFALIWWLICLSHGDFDHLDEEDWTPCVESVNSFVTCFLFSLETQHTIGYGYRYISHECPEAVFILCIQSITGVMIQCFMAGIVFAKLSRPIKRSTTLMFSRYACVCLRDGVLCFMFRVGDVRKSHIIGASVSAQIIRKKQTEEGEVIPYYHTRLDVRFDDGGDDVLLIWPATIVHYINEDSPFYLKSAEHMLRERFEVVVILEGTIESTGQSIQARSSYVASEILWGHRFDQVVSFRKLTGEYVVDYSKFNATHEVQTPLCCSKNFEDYQRMLAEMAKVPAFVNIGNGDNSNENIREAYSRSNSAPEYKADCGDSDSSRPSQCLLAPLAPSEC